MGGRLIGVKIINEGIGLFVHLAALFEPHRSLQIAPAKKNPSMRIIIPPKLSLGKRKSTFKMAEVYLQAGV